MDGSLKEGNNWRSQPKTSHKPIRPMMKSLNTKDKSYRELRGA